MPSVMVNDTNNYAKHKKYISRKAYHVNDSFFPYVSGEVPENIPFTKTRKIVLARKATTRKSSVLTVFSKLGILMGDSAIKMDSPPKKK